MQSFGAIPTILKPILKYFPLRNRQAQARNHNIETILYNLCNYLSWIFEILKIHAILWGYPHHPQTHPQVLSG